MNKTEKAVFDHALSHYGKDEQMRIAQEECAELISALSKYHRVETFQAYDKRKLQRAINHVAEEIADVQIMLDQLQLMFGFTKKQLDEIRASKIERLDGNLPEEENNAI